MIVLQVVVMELELVQVYTIRLSNYKYSYTNESICMK
jgi:hypothetical protein